MFVVPFDSSLIISFILQIAVPPLDQSTSSTSNWNLGMRHRLHGYRKHGWGHTNSSLMCLSVLCLVASCKATSVCQNPSLQYPHIEISIHSEEESTLSLDVHKDDGYFVWALPDFSPSRDEATKSHLLRAHRDGSCSRTSTINKIRTHPLGPFVGVTRSQRVYSLKRTPVHQFFSLRKLPTTSF